MIKIKVILGSTRPNRFGEQAAAWVMEHAKAYRGDDVTFELIDLKEVNLPFLDEPQPPAGGAYAHEHTKKWSKVIDEADGYIFVHPEYNHSVSAALKNAIDFLWQEWNYKPLALVGYGADAGGARAAEHLRCIAGQTKMFDLREQIVLANYKRQLDENDKFIPTDGNNTALDKLIKEIAFWSVRLKPLREERQRQA